MRSMGVWSWRTRGVWQGIILLWVGRRFGSLGYWGYMLTLHTERTFLAWLRTSLAFASIGVAITQLFRLNTTISPVEGTVPEPTDSAIHFRSLGKPLGAAFLGISIVVLLIGFHRYFEAQYWVTKGKFPASRGSIAIVAVVAGALMVTSLVVVVVVEPRAR